MRTDGMEVFQLVGIALITGVAALILRGTKPELAFAVSVAGGIILLLFAFELFRESLGIFSEIASASGLDSSLVKILLKMLGIGYLVQFGADTLTDFGQSALADKLVFCGKIVVLVLSLPILRGILTFINQLLGVI